MSSLYAFENEDYTSTNINTNGHNDPLIQKIIIKNKKIDYYSFCIFLNMLFTILNGVLLVVVYLYVSETSNTISILNTPNVSNAINQVEDILNYVCKEFNISCL